MPKIILGVFVGQADMKRPEVFEALKKDKEDVHDEDDENRPKHIIEHVIDQVWKQYDEGKNQTVDEDECKNFILMVLDVHEQTIAKESNREPVELDEEAIEIAL